MVAKRHGRAIGLWFFPLLAHALSLTSFTAGSPISASSMNSNFSSISSAISTLPWTLSSGNAYYSAGYVGIGTTLPVASLDVWSSGAGVGTGILLTDGGARSVLAGIRTEVNGQLIDIGVNTPWFGTASPSYQGGMFRIDVRSGLSLYQWFGGSSGTSVNQIATLTNAGAFSAVSVSQTSDGSLKKDICLLDGSLGKIRQLQGVSFLFKKYPGKRHLGFIAQDVERVFPDLVDGAEGSKTLNYDGLLAPSIEALKELDKIVEQLREGYKKQQEELEKQAQLIRVLQEEIAILRASK